MNRVFLASILLVVGSHQAVGQSEDSLPALEERALRTAALQVAPAVVRIRTIGGLEQVEGTLVDEGPTSGLIIDPQGWILSSAFGFASKPSSIVVTLADETRLPAQLVATDYSRMVVLLKVDTDESLPVAPMAASQSIEVGQWCVALGRTYDQKQVNVSVGIVSGTRRMYGRALQTDAKVSSANYGGPLVNIFGEILGLLVPLSPESDSVVAGSDWYDSGIGFAIPISDLLTRLEAMKKGQDLYPGKLGVALEKGPSYSTPATLALVVPNSPAQAAGLEKGDLITRVDGAEIRHQNDLHFALKPKYGGESVQMTFKRQGNEQTTSVELAIELKAYDPGFMGVLPERHSNRDSGVSIRHVFEGSAADQAGLQVGDVILQLDGEVVRDRVSAMNRAFRAPFDTELELVIERDGEQQRVSLVLTKVQADLAKVAPLVRPVLGEQDKLALNGKKLELKLPEFVGSCQVYLPTSYRAEMPHACIIWMPSPDTEVANVVEAWRSVCDARHIVLLVPRPNGATWERTDAEYLAKLMDLARSKYNLDASRCVIGGATDTSLFAFLTVGQNRDRFQGIVAVGRLPRIRSFTQFASDPLHRLFILKLDSTKPDVDKADAAGIERQFTELGLPVTFAAFEEDASELGPAQYDKIGLWIDTLDRF